MDELYRNIIEYLTPEQINDIYQINKMNLKGFRANSKHTQAKSERMKQELSKKQYLTDYINNLLDHYEDNLKINYSWAMTDLLTIEDINQQLEEKKHGEIILALLLAKKEDALQSWLEILKPRTRSSTSQTAVKQVPTSSEATTLRNLLKQKEEELTKSSLSNKELLSKTKELEQQLSAAIELKDKYKKEASDKTLSIQQLNTTIKDLNEEIELFDEELAKAKIENDELNRLFENKQVSASKSLHLHVLVLGSSSFKKYWSQKLFNVNGIEYYYVSCEELLTNELPQLFHQILILHPTLNTSDLNFLNQQDFFKKGCVLNIVHHLNSHQEINNYIESVGNYND